MARTVVGSAVVVREKYYWPDAQLNIWTIIMLATAGLILGVSAQFMMIQNTMRLQTPWILPYGVTVGALTIVFIIVELILIAQRRLLPGVMMLLSFILLVLFITGIIGTAIQLFGGPNINNQCNAYVFNRRERGASLETLAWLQQQSICQSWQAAFAFWIIGSVFMVWMMVMASQVNQNQYD
ncbi:hypothetical protein BU24DRAFT_287213 [Aaosphaeria arxii CBS 175.79]|uniref:MARVEL domain-containing protein n=1 Tax=Aaosphaeria arxii CBS 175.79 TaxID=1450172 RepID=A0A6A5XF12_9PLEO|nr:uncharacterized protein BU24DRAFT_287213 [Aaosphaeria arxii CBS 175.79]KAF2011692.1 hypothetical protein BU24DRAFT_287213 [Aaosphaeria arxii CBS 175.79]